MTLRRLHASAPSRKVQTIGQSYEHLAHDASRARSPQRAPRCTRYLALRVTSRFAYEWALDGWVNETVRTRGGEDRRHRGRPLPCAQRPHLRRTALLRLGGAAVARAEQARAVRSCPHRVHVATACPRCGAFRRPERVEGAANPHELLRGASCGGCWQRDVDASGGQVGIDALAFRVLPWLEICGRRLSPRSIPAPAPAPACRESRPTATRAPRAARSQPRSEAEPRKLAPHPQRSPSGTRSTCAFSPRIFPPRVFHRALPSSSPRSTARCATLRARRPFGTGNARAPARLARSGPFFTLFAPRVCPP